MESLVILHCGNVKVVSQDEALDYGGAAARGPSNYLWGVKEVEAHHCGDIMLPDVGMSLQTATELLLVRGLSYYDQATDGTGLILNRVFKKTPHQE